MDWFKRYGIPGAYFIGLTLVSLMILYPCKINLHNEHTLKIVGGIFAGGFLPLGYLLCMVGQANYFFTGTFELYTGALSIYNHNHQSNDPVYLNDWAVWAKEGIEEKWWLSRDRIILPACAMLSTLSKLGLSIKTYKHSQEWIRKRMDILVINHAIMAGTIVSTIVVFCLCLLPTWSLQPDNWWNCIYYLAVIILFFILRYVNIILCKKMEIVLAGIYNLEERPPSGGNAGTPTGPGGSGTSTGQNNIASQTEQSKDKKE